MTSSSLLPASTLPAWPCLRPDVRLIAPPLRPLRLALAPRHVVRIDDPPPGLAQWLADLDGLAPLDAAIARSPVAAPVAARLLEELDRAGLLLDANGGRPFRGHSDQEGALRLAAQARTVGRSEGTSGPIRVWVRGTEPWRSRLASALEACAGLLCATDGPPADLMAIPCTPFDPALNECSDLARDLRLPHTAIVVSSVDAVLTPLLLPGTPCLHCWWEHTESAGDDWNAWQFRGRTVDPPRLPVHHVDLVIGLAVEHLLLSAQALQGRVPFASAGFERRFDLLDATMSVRRIGRRPGCACQLVAPLALRATPA